MQSSMFLSPSAKSMTSSCINPMLNSNPLLSSSIDEKSQKDITEILNKCIENSRNLTEFSKVLQIDNINAPTISGHSDFYYPNLVFQFSHFQQELPEISKIKHVPIPLELMEQFSQIQINCAMGLFTCISRAWLTIDNLIFFWNYEDGTDICFYDNLLEPILAVELFVPKENTFDNGIEYGLCLATNSQVALLSVDFIRYTKGNGAIVNEMRFSPQPVYSIPTDSLIINSLKSAKSTGRIFMGAKDGSLYEFFYQNQTGWFSSQTKKINLSHSKFHYLVPSFLSFNDADSIVQIEIDETRNILYTRSENSTIQVFYLGPNGTDTSKISSLNCNSIASKAANLLNSNDKHLFMPLVNISVIKQIESKNINLVAVTQFGIRLYFSVSPFHQFEQVVSPDQGPPSTFQLVHVRIPPNIELSSQNRNGPVNSAYINNGISLMMTKRDDQNDTVLVLNRDLFLLHNNYKESKCIFNIDGRIWNCQEIEPSLNSIRTAALENDNLQTIKSATGIENIPKLSGEYFDLPRRFVMITPQGCFIWNKMRPIDQLTACLRESNGPNSDSVRLFFNKIYEKSEACALCLAVALNYSGDARLFEWATQAYFMYSGEPEIRRKSSYTLGTSNPVTQSQSNQPFNPQNSLFDSGMEQNENSIYDVTMMNRVQPKTALNSVSILNSPQQMSTPIVMRTKDNFQTPGRQLRTQSNIQSAQSLASVQQQKSECEIYFSGKHDAIYIYLSRLLSPIWDLKLLDELPGSNVQNSSGSFNMAESTIFATFSDIHIQWFLNKLNELRSFIELNYPQLKTVHHSHVTGSLFGLTEQVTQSPGGARMPQTPKFATQFQSIAINLHALNNLTGMGIPLSEKKIAEEIELGSIYLIKQFLNRIIEIFGLWKILDDHKFHFISSKLDRQTQLILVNMVVKNFLLSDDNFLDQLITALLYRYIDDNACTDLLNQSLKQMCPSLYTNENAIFSKACEKLKQALNIKNDSFERDRLLKEAVDLVKQIGYVANLGQVCEMLYSAGCYEAIFELCITAAEKRDPQNIAVYFYRKNEPAEDIQGQHYYQLRIECYKSMLDCLTNLTKTPTKFSQQKSSHFTSKEKLEEEINYLIRYVVNSKDELAQVSLFNWMITNGLEKKLVTLDSTFLEFYLVRQFEIQLKNRIYLDLLWRHYDYKKDYIKASKVLITLAEKESSTQITLRERVEYLTQAIVALNSSQKSSVKDEIAELNDRKDVALLQEKIFDELGKMEPKNEAIQEALNQLDSKLYDITKLFYDFAEKFELCQFKLAIFKMSRHEDPGLIEICWKQIIANEIEKIKTRSDIKPNDIEHELAEKLILIAKEYVDDEKYFPLNSLIDSLEYVSLSRNFEPDWCCTMLRRLNLPFEQLIQAYDQVYINKDIKWGEHSSRLINSIYCLIELFTKAPRATCETDKVFFLRSVNDLIPKYLTELNSINDVLSRELITGFKSLNCMLDRM